MTGHGLNDQDARALTYLARRLRDETHGCRAWDEAGIFAKLTELAGQNLALSIERVLCHATDPEAKTPGAILRNFTPPKPSNQPTNQPTAKRGNPHRDEECKLHPGQWPETCAGCNTERYRTDDDPEPTSPMARDTALAEARAALVAAKHTEEEA